MVTGAGLEALTGPPELLLAAFFLFLTSVSSRPGEELLIQRSIYKGMINPGEEKLTVASQSAGARLEYAIRVRCDEHYYGPKCNKVCRPRDDYFGHYVCDHQGERECMEGWTNLTTSCKTGRKRPPRERERRAGGGG